VLVGSAAMLVALSLSGCFAQETPDATSSPSPSTTPVFASEEEALAAATEAYGNYQELETEIFGAGGTAAARIEAVSTRAALDEALAGFARFEHDGLHSVGEPSFTIAKLQHVSPPAGNGYDVVGAYLCLDVSGVDVLDSKGTSVVSPTRNSIQAYEISFDQQVGSSDSLVLSSREIWTGADLCD